MYAHRFESKVDVEATPEALFAEIDDHERLAAHMTQSSMMMGGGSMRYQLDEAGGKAIGSVIRMTGSVLGINLEVEETVTEREPPRRKVWETTGEPRLFIMGRYRMGFDIAPGAGVSQLTVFIEYEDPAPPWSMLGRLLGPVYARWCTISMAEGARKAFLVRRDSASALPPEQS